MHTLTKLAGAIAGAAAAAVLAAGPAGASPASDDANYLALITSPPEGMQPLSFDSADVAVIEGRAVCDMLDDGYSLSSALSAVDSVLPVNRDGAITVVSAAVVVYCPWHMPPSVAAA